MEVYQVLEARRLKWGMSKAELARRIELDDELMRRSLNGMRKIPAPQFVKLCRVLELTLDDFDGCVLTDSDELVAY